MINFSWASSKPAKKSVGLKWSLWHKSSRFAALTVFNTFAHEVWKGWKGGGEGSAFKPTSLLIKGLMIASVKLNDH